MTAVIQGGVEQFVRKLLTNPLRAASLYPRRWCLHVEKMAAVSEAVGHAGTHQGGRCQQGEGEDAGAQQMHHHTTGADENNMKPARFLIIWGSTCPVIHHFE